ncbi:Hypothetical predicted protein [Paramuricea clavata]|uniref:Uncharacterized protein n=1 Tax=Paramuricea clavata TaxID=317549 RepID=A0A6S7FW54_PARCT|nr:Hypothetical predicted protein [Paramuricea clavata]
MDVDKIVFYTDSRIVLGYIQNERRRFFVYVANRIQTIRHISDPTQWKYVDSTENPVDIATRGKPAKDLMHSFWFTGPEFLKNPDSTDSSSEIIDVEVFEIDENDPEVHTQITTYVTEHSKAQGLGSSRFERFSEWSSLRRAISNLTIRIKLRKTDDHHLLTLKEVPLFYRRGVIWPS